MENLLGVMRDRAAARRKAGNVLGGSGGKSLANLPTSRDEDSEPIHVHSEIAKAVGVSPRTAQDALTVKRQDPELWEDVKAGISLLDFRPPYQRHRAFPPPLRPLRAIRAT